jgi:hypothetical protein
LKIKGLSKDRSPKPFEIGGATFYIRPADQNLRSTFMSKSIAGMTELFSKDTKRYFATRCIDGWDDVPGEDGKPIEYTEANAIDAMTDEENDDVFYELFNFSWKISQDAEKNQSEDAEIAKKK